MKNLLCFAALLVVTQCSTQPHTSYPPVFGYPGSDPRCREDGDVVMDPDNRCQVFKCVMKEKKHGYDDKNVYKYFDVEKVMCPYKTINVHIQQPHGYQPSGYQPPQNAVPHGTGYGQPQPTYGQHQPTYGQSHRGYGNQYHEIEVQTAVDKYTHANYLGTRVKGVAEALCNVDIHKPSEQCTDVHKH